MADLLRPEELAAWFEELLPVRGGAVALEAAPQGGEEGCVIEDARGGLAVVFRLVVYELNDDGEIDRIRDIKEQQIFVVGAEHRDEPGRVRAFVEAWASIMPEVLGRLGDEVDTLMPHDLVNFSPLALARATTSDDFRRALLVKSRYGRLLGRLPLAYRPLIAPGRPRRRESRRRAPRAGARCAA